MGRTASRDEVGVGRVANKDEVGVVATSGEMASRELGRGRNR